MTPNPRLPPHIVPSHYELELAPDLEAATFTGSVAVDVDVIEPTAEIVCNAAELEIDTAVIEIGDHLLDPTVRVDTATERLHLTVAEPLAAGPARLRLRFRGVLNDMLRGFYRSTYVDNDGRTHTIATTQFQSTDARRAFPCWDEPALKATFATTLVVASDQLAISNTSEIREEALDDGRRRVTFAPTMLMSTYLVAFVVGPLEVTGPVDAGGVPIRVVHPPGKGHLTSFALEVAVHALDWFADYYAIPYPSDKVDLVAIPDFAFGAMENLGCVTFREVVLLIDPAAASQPELQNVADVVNHELAHMWFGDLVTMRWWEGIWLNEAFATFMETACSNAFRPDWDVWTSFGRGRAAAFATDALASTRPIEYPVVTPADAEGMFDILTYEKGASVVRMLERFLGEEAFRDGVRHYLRTHSHGNTETSDLWDALEEVSAQPVRRIMEGWILQGGHPVIEIEPSPDGTTIRQRQFTFAPEAADDRRWAVPLRLRIEDQAEETRLLLDEPSITLPDAMQVVTANADASGFYRVRPDRATLDRIVARGPDGLEPPERHGVVDDSWALTVAGELTAADFLRLATAFSSDDDLTVWQALSVGLSGLTRLVDNDVAPLLRGRIAALATPAAAALGTEPRPGEDDRTRERRATLLRLLGTVADDTNTIAIARTLLRHADPTLAAAALVVVAHHGDDDENERIRAAWQAAEDPQTEQRNLRALADFPDPDLVARVLDETLDGTVRSQDGPYLIRRALTNRHAGPTTWSFVARRWDDINRTFPSNSIARMLEGIVVLDDPDLAAEVEAFLDAHPVPQGELQVAQHLELLRVNMTLRARERTRFGDHLRS